jgi:aminoglycoside phosphotransferase (APT) family kinase protein
MTDPETRALSARLNGFLRSSYPGAEAVDLRRLSHRWQVRSLRFTWVESGSRTDCVLRLFEGGEAVQRCEREAELTIRLSGQGFPVPGVLAHSSDMRILGQPFQIVCHIKGQTLADELYGSEGNVRERCIDRFMGLMVRMHRIPVAQVMPSRRCTARERAGLFHERLMAQARAVLLDTLRLGEFEPLLVWIDDTARGISWSDAVLAHNDFHPGNILCGADGVDRVIDWATVDVSDHRYDLGWTLMLTASYWGGQAHDSVLRAYARGWGRPIESIEVFILVAAVRRLLLRGLAAHAAAWRIGMPGRAMFSEPREAEHLRAVYALVPQICGLRLPGIERVLDGWR